MSYASSCLTPTNSCRYIRSFDNTRLINILLFTIRVKQQLKTTCFINKLKYLYKMTGRFYFSIFDIDTVAKQNIYYMGTGK